MVSLKEKEEIENLSFNEVVKKIKKLKNNKVKLIFSIMYIVISFILFMTIVLDSIDLYVKIGYNPIYNYFFPFDIYSKKIEIAFLLGLFSNLVFSIIYLANTIEEKAKNSKIISEIKNIRKNDFVD